MMQQTVLLNTKSTSTGTRGAIYQEFVPFSLPYPHMGDSLIKGEELLRDQLLETKFFVPVASHALIPRPRLTALLDACPRRPLTLVSAPAGFGKTTLLSQWVQTLSNDVYSRSDHVLEGIETSSASFAEALYCGRPGVAWVSLDEEDNDPVRFWRYVLTALDRLQPGVCTDLVTRLRAQSSPSQPCLFTTLINRLVQSTEQMMLVLDDYHMITDQAVHTSFASLVEHLPAQLRVVLSTRVDPPFPLSRLRARSQLLEVRTEQLRCSDTEVADFLHEIVGVELFDDEVQQMATRTGGWLAGLQLLDLSLQRRESSFYLQEAISNSHHHILDYLTEEVLRQQPLAIQRFLLNTSILERLTASLCDAVLEQSGSQQVLEELKRNNVFLISLDSQRCWYRYHPLFAEALRFLLERIEPESLEALHLRASEWYAENDYTEDAVQHAVLAHAWQQAADLIEVETRTPSRRRWEQATLRHWLEQLPSEVIRARPRLCFAYASALLPVASTTTVDAWLEAAEAGLAILSTLLSDTQAVDKTSVQDDGKDLLQEIAAFRTLHTSGIGHAVQWVQGFSHKEEKVSPPVNERSQAAQVEVLPAQAKPVAPRAEARTEEAEVLIRAPQASLRPLRRPYELPAPQRASQQDLLDPLSVRELEVLQLMAQGSTNQEIARALTLATETIKRHVSNIMSKLEVCNRTQAVVRGHSLGLLL